MGINLQLSVVTENVQFHKLNFAQFQLCFLSSLPLSSSYVVVVVVVVVVGQSLSRV